MNNFLAFAIFGLGVSAAYGQIPEAHIVARETFQTVTDSMLRYEKYLYTDEQLEAVPTFPGGRVSFERFQKKNLKYPAQAIENETQGWVVLGFIVEKNGKLTNIAILRDIGDGCGEEAVRLLRKSPKWIPGKIRNIPVRTKTSFGITFVKPDSDD